MKLEEITNGLSLAGVVPSQIVTVVALVPHGNGALQIIYRTPDGVMKERLLVRADESSITLAKSERPFSFDGDGSAFQLTCEAKRKRWRRLLPLRWQSWNACRNRSKRGLR